MEKISTKNHWQTYWSRPDHQPVVRLDEMLANILATTSVKGKKILEIGVGMGGDSIYLAKKGARVTAIDFTNEALEKVRKNSKMEKIRVETVRADARKMPFANASFDIVFHQGFLEHFTKPLEMIAEQLRVLKQGGLLVIDVPQRFTTYTIKKHLLMWMGKWFAGWEREFSIGELEALVRRAGLVPVRSYGWGYYGKLYNLRHARLGKWYKRLWQRIEESRFKLYLCWCVGVIARKP